MIARHPVRPLVLAAAALTLGAPAVAQGQEVGPYDPLGIRAGGFLIYPSLSVSEVYDDNVFAVDNNKDDDLITLIQPGVRAVSNFSRHRLGLTAGSEVAVPPQRGGRGLPGLLRLGRRPARHHPAELRRRGAGVRARSYRPRRSRGPGRSRRAPGALPLRRRAQLHPAVQPAEFPPHRRRQPHRLHRGRGRRPRPEHLQRPAAHGLLRIAAHQHLRRRASTPSPSAIARPISPASTGTPRAGA